MKKIQQTILILFLTSGLLVSMSYAKSNDIDYKSMPTPELQKKVEELSNKGKLSFDMAFELIKRWQNEADTSK